MLDLPRSARLAAWGTAVLTGSADPVAAVRAVTRDDEPHRVVLPGADPDSGGPGAGRHVGGSLIDLFGALAARDTAGLRVLLPAPGDLLGLPGPRAFNEAALDAGECVLVEPADDSGAVEAGAWGIVPEVTTFGSAWEPGAMVTWRVHETSPRRVTVLGGVAEADRELRGALEEASLALSRLDVARWRDDAAERLAEIREGGMDRGVLPPTLPPRCLRVLATAARVQAIVELAVEDDGGSVTGFEATARAEALRGLDRVSRRAVVAAVNGLLEPT